MNLQLAALTRLQGRTHFSPQDAQNLVRIVRILVTPPNIGGKYAGKRSDGQVQTGSPALRQ
jgi:hypothetical protein